jgi:hypothetical protein
VTESAGTNRNMKKATKKSVKGKTKAAGSAVKQEPVNLQELRERVRRVVAEQAETMTKAAAEEAAKGHVAQLKYLFEMIGLYPAEGTTEAEPVEGDDLTKTLLARLDFPHQLPADEEDAELPGPTVVGSDSVE